MRHTIMLVAGIAMGVALAACEDGKPKVSAELLKPAKKLPSLPDNESDPAARAAYYRESRLAYADARNRLAELQKAIKTKSSGER